jgi:hypothetical protein
MQLHREAQELGQTLVASECGLPRTLVQMPPDRFRSQFSLRRLETRILRIFCEVQGV